MKTFFCHPLVYLASLFARGPSFTKLIQETHAIQPSSHDQPWDLIIYADESDEIIPGNVLGRAQRKTWCVYTSFLQFKHHLCHEEAWLTIACERSNWVSSLEGGVSQMVRDILRCPTRAWCLPVEASNRGHQAPLPVVHGLSRWSCLQTDLGVQGGITDQHILKHNQLVLTTDQEVLQPDQKLHTRQAMTTKKDFEMWQQATGWTAFLLDTSLLEARALKLVRQFCHDYMHASCKAQHLWCFTIVCAPSMDI